MNSVSKLGADRSIAGLVPAIVTLISIAAVWALLGREAAFLSAWGAFVVFTALAVIAFLRTRSRGYLASAFYLCCCSLILGVRTGLIPIERERFPAVTILFMVSVVCLVFMLLTKQAKWRGRDILELAAQPVEDVADGYTPRPRPIGRAGFTRNEILEFARFARRKLIAMTYVEPERVVFVPVKMGTEYGYLFSWHRDYSKDTWVAFENDGNVIVNISKADYQTYKDDFAFDKLCQSLADVFLDFLELYRKGQDVRIMDRMDAMQIGVFS